MPSHAPRNADSQPRNLPNPGQEALLKACLSPPEQFHSHWRRWRELEDIEQLDESSNRLVPLLFRQAEKARLVDPEMGRLRGIYRYHWCRNQLMLSELRRILLAMNAAANEVMLLKGASMIQAYYEDPALRPMSDLDLMVRPERFEDASKVLRELGYVPRYEADFTEIRSARLTHALEFTRIAHGQTWEIDLHWTPMHRATWAAAEACFWDHSIRLDFKGTNCRTFDATHQLLHVCLHGALWNALPPLRWVTDAMWILRKEKIEWSRLIEDARKFNGLQLLQNSLQYIDQHFEAPIPEEVTRALQELTPSRFERLEFALQTSSSNALRIDQLLLLEWMNHSRAFQGLPWWRPLGSFPKYLRAAWKLARWREVPSFVLKRLQQRAQAKTA